MSSPGGEEGGTRIQKRPQAQPQFNQPPQMQPPPEQMYQQPPQQMYQQPPQQMYHQPPQQAQLNIPKLKTASRFSNVDFDSVTFKYSIIVACIFVLLNSKIIWKQIIQFPFMGGVEPSILALIINSILAAIIFYVVSKQF
jgi:hypothetical protein